MDICTDSGSTPDISTKYGAFVYRLGHKIFILGRGVRLPYALQIKLLNIQIGCCEVIAHYHNEQAYHSKMERYQL